jgi:hypothetical protein
MPPTNFHGVYVEIPTKCKLFFVSTLLLLVHNSLKVFVTRLKVGKTYCPLMEGVLIMVIVVDGVAVPTKGQFDVATLVDEKKCPYVIKK